MVFDDGKVRIDSCKNCLLRDFCAMEGYTVVKWIRSVRELDFPMLMEVYVEGNRENGADNYPQLSAEQQLLQAEQDFYAFLREFFSVEGSVYAVWQAEGKYASALRLEPYRDGYLLEALETAPELRRRGYARQLILAVLETVCREKGATVYSHVHKKNVPSLAVHKACGFERILEHAVYIDGSVTQRSCTLRRRGE